MSRAHRRKIRNLVEAQKLAAEYWREEYGESPGMTCLRQTRLVFALTEFSSAMERAYYEGDLPIGGRSLPRCGLPSGGQTTPALS